MCCLRENILTLRLSVGGRTDARTDGRTENIYSIFKDKLLLLGEHGYYKRDMPTLVVSDISS